MDVSLLRFGPFSSPKGLPSPFHEVPGKHAPGETVAASRAQLLSRWATFGHLLEFTFSPAHPITTAPTLTESVYSTLYHKGLYKQVIPMNEQLLHLENLIKAMHLLSR